MSANPPDPGLNYWGVPYFVRRVLSSSLATASGRSVSVVRMFSNGVPLKTCPSRSAVVTLEASAAGPMASTMVLAMFLSP